MGSNALNTMDLLIRTQTRCVSDEFSSKLEVAASKPCKAAGKRARAYAIHTRVSIGLKLVIYGVLKKKLFLVQGKVREAVKRFPLASRVESQVQAAARKKQNERNNATSCIDKAAFS